MSKRRHRTSNSVEHRMVRAIDQLSAYDEFTSDILPILREAINKNWSADDIRNDPRIKAALVARQVSIALKEPDAHKANSAIKDLLDRTEGKPKESRDINVKYEDMSDSEIDSKLNQLMAQESDDDQPSDDSLN